MADNGNGNGNYNISDQFLKQAIEEVETALKKKGLSNIDRVGLITHRSVLYFIKEERGERLRQDKEIKLLKDNSVLLWVKNNKVTAGLLISALLIVNSYWNWAGLRAEWLGPLLSALGIHVPIP